MNGPAKTRLMLLAALSCGIAFTQGCGCGSDKIGSEMGYQTTGDRVPWEQRPDEADDRRSGPTNGLRVTPAPTVKEQTPYGVPPSAQELGLGAQAGAGGAGGPGAPAAPGLPPVPTRDRLH